MKTILLRFSTINFQKWIVQRLVIWDYSLAFVLQSECLASVFHKETIELNVIVVFSFIVDGFYTFFSFGILSKTDIVHRPINILPTFYFGPTNPVLVLKKYFLNVPIFEEELKTE